MNSLLPPNLELIIRPVQYRDLDALERLRQDCPQEVPPKYGPWLGRWFGVLKFFKLLPQPMATSFPSICGGARS